MTRTEERLADALQAVASAVRPGTLRPLPDNYPERLRGADRQRRGDTRWLAPVAAAAAVALIAGLSVILGGSSAGHGPLAQRHAAQPGLPRYYVINRQVPCCGTGPTGQFIEVRATATGRLTDRFLLPRQSRSEQFASNSLTAAADQRTFFVAYFRSDLKTRSSAGASIYRFRLSSSGHVTGFTLVWAVPSRAPIAMAASPDGTQLAVAQPPPRPGESSTMVIVDVAGRVPPEAIGFGAVTNLGIVTQLSWVGHRLALLSVYGHPVPYPDAFHIDEEKVWVWDTGAGPGPPGLALTHAGSASQGISGAIIDPDGNRLYLLVGLGKPEPDRGNLPGTVQVWQTSRTARGSRPKVIYSGKAGNSSGPYLRTDGAGHLLLAANWTIGWLGGGRLHPLPPREDGTEIDFAW